MTTKNNTIDQVTAVILVGSRDFGRCPTATRLNRALWPLAGKPVLQRLLENLAEQGIRRAVLCCENQAAQTRTTLDIPDDIAVTFIEETMPRGTAGCLRDAAAPGSDDVLLVLPGCTILPPSVDEVLTAHQSGQGVVTVFFSDTLSTNGSRLYDAQLYVCDPSLLELIPEKGYCDIKEGLVPVLVSADKPIAAAQLSDPIGGYIQWRQYLHAAGQFLCKIDEGKLTLPAVMPADGHKSIWVGTDVVIADSARLYGPVLIESGSEIQSDAIVIGPTLIGKNVTVGSRACIEQSVIWDGSRIGQEAHICQSLVDHDRRVPDTIQLHGQLVGKPSGRLAGWLAAIKLRLTASKRPTAPESCSNTLGNLLRRPIAKWVMGLSMVLLLAGLLVTYWQPTIQQLLRIWLESDEYSSGLLVPFLAGYVVWMRRQSFLDCPVRPAMTGLLALLAAQGMRLFGLYFMFASAERLALISSIGGIVLLLFGWPIFKRFLSVFVFLFLMLPLPNRVESWITLPLQQYATVSAVFSLETLGYGVIREGNVIRIGETVVAVAEACNGLRMLTAFFVISGFIVLITNRKPWEKAIVLISTIPIALLCNTIRLTLTSIAFTFVHTEELEELFHDFGGLAMMPLAIALVVFQLWLLKVLFMPPESIEHQVVVRRNNESGR